MKLPKVFALKQTEPKGDKLTGVEADALIKDWGDQKSLVYQREQTLSTVADKIEVRQGEISDDLPEATTQLREAKRIFKITKNPVARRKWARKVVLRSAYYEYLRNSKITLESTVERVRDAIEDAKLVYDMIDHRVKDAKIYRELNGGIHLVGKALIDARSRHQFPEIEYQSLEYSMEQLESEVSSKTDDQVLIEAQSIVEGGKSKNE